MKQLALVLTLALSLSASLAPFPADSGAQPQDLCQFVPYFPGCPVPQ